VDQKATAIDVDKLVTWANCCKA